MLVSRIFPTLLNANQTLDLSGAIISNIFKILYDTFTDKREAARKDNKSK